jgi:hypothetical protein
MGNLFGRCCPPEINPDPKKFEILRLYYYDTWVVAWVHYPNCTNLGGNKILVYSVCTIPTIENLEELDPHFEKFIPHKWSPAARFFPDSTGWAQAIRFIRVECKRRGAISLPPVVIKQKFYKHPDKELWSWASES